MLNLIDISRLVALLGLLTLEADFNFNLNLIEIIKAQHQQQSIQSIIFMSHDGVKSTEGAPGCDENKFAEMLQYHLELPMFQLKGNFSFYLRRYYNHEVLTVLFLKGNANMDNVDNVESMWMTLRCNRNARLILLANSQISDTYLSKILKFCVDNKSVNTIVLKLSTKNAIVVYKAKIFPEFSMESLHYETIPNSEFFSNQVKNMHKHPFRVDVPKLSSKAYILKMDVNGQPILGGYVGHLLSQFAQKHNATLLLPHVEQQYATIFDVNYTNFVESNYDISAEPYFYPNYTGVDLDVTHPYTSQYVCIMAPVEKPVPPYLFYAIIFDSKVAILIVIASVAIAFILSAMLWIAGEGIRWKNFLLDIDILWGFLGKGFKTESTSNMLRSFLYILVSLGGIICNTSFVTYLQSFSTQPPTEMEIKTLDDLRKSGRHFTIFKEEYEFMKEEESVKPYRSLVHIMSSAKEFYELRDNLDTRYLYAVSPQSWMVYNKQQQFFKKPLFHLTDMVVTKTLGSPLFLPVDSPYTNAMNFIIDHIFPAGLYDFWTSLSFLERLRLKRLHLRDLSVDTHFTPMKVEDLQLVMYVFVAMAWFMLLCFVAEMLWPKRDKILRRFKA